MDKASTRAEEVANALSSLEAYLAFLEEEHESFMHQHPKAAVNIWKEKLLASLLVGDTAQAADIARSRIAARDQGGFISGGKSFFERSLVVCDADGMPPVHV